MMVCTVSRYCAEDAQDTWLQSRDDVPNFLGLRCTTM